MTDRPTDQRPEHRSSVELFPYQGKWIAWCVLCGQVGLGEDTETDAWAVAERHQQRVDRLRDYEW